MRSSSRNIGNTSRRRNHGRASGKYPRRNCCRNSTTSNGTKAAKNTDRNHLRNSGKYLVEPLVETRLKLRKNSCENLRSNSSRSHGIISGKNLRSRSCRNSEKATYSQQRIERYSYTSPELLKNVVVICCTFSNFDALLLVEAFYIALPPSPRQ